MIINFASTILEIKLFITSSTCYYKSFRFSYRKLYPPPLRFPFFLPLSCLFVFPHLFPNLVINNSSEAMGGDQWRNPSPDQSERRWSTNQSSSSSCAFFLVLCRRGENCILFLCYSRIVKKTRMVMFISLVSLTR